jgi:hypothetical protein
MGNCLNRLCVLSGLLFLDALIVESDEPEPESESKFRNDFTVGVVAFAVSAEEDLKLLPGGGGNWSKRSFSGPAVSVRRGEETDVGLLELASDWEGFGLWIGWVGLALDTSIRKLLDIKSVPFNTSAPAPPRAAADTDHFANRFSSCVGRVEVRIHAEMRISRTPVAVKANFDWDNIAPKRGLALRVIFPDCFNWDRSIRTGGYAAEGEARSKGTGRRSTKDSAGPASARGYPGCTQRKAVHSPVAAFAASWVPDIPTGSSRSRPTGLTHPYGACLDERDKQTNTPPPAKRF